MGAATDLAAKAGATFLDQGILGALVIILALAVIATVVFHVKTAGDHAKALVAKDKEHAAAIAVKDQIILNLGELHRNDLKLMAESTAKTVEALRIIATAMPRRR